jgi:1,2-diacylglycerol 3-alpha-glucosyltransferase
VKIGIFTDSYTPLVSGVTYSVNIEAEFLRKLGHEVYIFCLNNKALQVQEYLVPFTGIRIPIGKLKMYSYDLFTIFKHKRVKNIALDIAHLATEFTFPKVAFFAKKYHNIPLIYTMHTAWEDFLHFLPMKLGKLRPVKKFVRKKIRRIANKSNLVIAPSQKIRSVLESYKVTTPIEILPTGIDLDRFSRYDPQKIRELREQYGIRTDDFNLIIVGRISLEKNIIELLHIIRETRERIANLHFIVVGGGMDLPVVIKESKNLNIYDCITFTGMVDYQQIPNYFRLGDLYVNTSLSETQGLTFIEALACRLPVVALYDQPIADVVKDGVNGFLVSDRQAFVEKLVQISADKDLYQRLVGNTQESVHRYSAQAFAKRIENISLDLIDRNKSGQTNTKSSKRRFRA